MSQITNYWFWDKFFSKEEIQQINEFIEQEHEGLESDNVKGYGKRVSDVKNISYGKIKHLVHKLVDIAYFTTNVKFGYQTFEPRDSQNLILNTYVSDSKDSYDWHIDTDSSLLFDTKCTLVINASTDEYEGGGFQFFQNYEQDIKPLDTVGSVVLIKSHLNHRVLPVTKGTRKSLVMFIMGNKFQ